MGRIKAIITDFDGTLVDTFMANYLAYKESFKKFGYSLTIDQYKLCYGLRYDGLCNKLNIAENDRDNIKEYKKKIYPSYFNYIKLNEHLVKFIISLKSMNIKTCIASTATRENLFAVLKHFNIDTYFDIIISGENVSKGKPDPEVYIKALNLLECESEEVIVFEDSDVGCEAVEAANMNYIKITKYE